MNAREKAIAIFNAAVAAVRPAQLVPLHLSVDKNTLTIFDEAFLINALKNIYVIGAGKASAAMAASVEQILNELLTDGVIVTKYGHSLTLQKITCLEAAHPVPDAGGLTAVEKTLQMLQRATEGDIIICLISGGASALWIDAPPGISLEDLQKTFGLLLQSGAGIDEMNVVRKHLSAIKGGQLLRHAPLANWFCFIISDVPGNRLDSIASGPTVPDLSSFSDAKSVLEKYALSEQVPLAILQYIEKGIRGKMNDTLAENSIVLKKVHNRIIGSNSMALQAASAKAIELGYHIPFIEDELNGDAAKVGREFTRSCKKYSGMRPACFLLGGETTVTVTGNGKGGRNQHMALSALCEMLSNEIGSTKNIITFLAGGTDGTDGPTGAAGAIADLSVVDKARELRIDASAYLEAHDAYHFFEQVDNLLVTGPTQTNVMDIVVVLVE